jgi:hypothetical protein
MCLSRGKIHVIPPLAGQSCYKNKKASDQFWYELDLKPEGVIEVAEGINIDVTGDG